ncbi:xylulokinase [Peribacillus sp. TH16]|uniref:xylulokinase n=1 Tax=Peribacillus TaxID=2675229 RepID=UPI001913AF0B|nr:MULTISPECIES: xylulokinase [unclassified Peribacillus]MBK5446980.1 xylulokinase [Peribacillus sp. TH24]MBK5458224.1 xylulokinase [Peribacillus sp. TH27]MBK5482563.1 xylulokinase [Peribacillus sp. TH16]WMX58802.1 xylulokinase [Peribacillus sp. R9-11]
MNPSLLLGIDIGTQGTKALVIDHNGHVVSTAQVSYTFDSPQPGWAEQSPSLWWESVISCLNMLWEKGIDSTLIRAVGTTGQMHSLVILDEQNQPIRPSILWNDGRTLKECSEMEEIIGADCLFKTVQNPILPGFTAPKLLWLKRNEPHHFSQIKKILMPKDYIVYELTGEYSADVTDASGTCLLNVQKREWAWDIIKDLGFLEEWFPPVSESKEVIGTISEKAAQLTGLPIGIPVIAGAGDNAAAALGNGIIKEMKGSISIGTSGTVFVPLNELPDVARDEASTLHLFCHCLPGMWHAMGTTLSAGMSLRWLRDTFEKETFDELLKGVDQVEPGAEGLLFFPYLNGERTPLNNPKAKGVFFGLTYRHHRQNMARAVIEGVCYSLRDVFDMMKKAGIEVEDWTVTGGAIKNPLWTEVLADVYQQSLHVHEEREGPAYGASILAGFGNGEWTAVSDLAMLDQQSKMIACNPKNKNVYDEQFARYQTIAQTINPLF